MILLDLTVCFILTKPKYSKKKNQETNVFRFFVFEYLAQKNSSMLLVQALERTCLLQYTDSDGLDLIHIHLEMFRFSREMEFMDENQARKTF